MDEWTFRDEINLSPLNLPRAALQFARAIAYPNLDVGHYIAQLDELARLAEKEIRPSDPQAVRAELLADVLFQRLGFRGNTADYYDPRNSFLNEVLDRRLGIPISLSLLYIAVAERLHINARGVGMPGHFIVLVRTGDKALFFDPFNGGGRLSITDCMRLVRSTTGYTGSFRPEWLRPLNARGLLTRMLNNLRLIYVQREMWPQAIVTIEHLHILDPQAPEYLRDLGLIHFQKGSIQLAAHYLNAYLEQAPHASEAETIRRGVAQALDAWVKRN